MDATYALRIDAMDLRPATRAAETRAVGDGGISGASDASSSRVCRPRMLARRGRAGLNRTRPAIRAEIGRASCRERGWVSMVAGLSIGKRKNQKVTTWS